MESNFSIPYGSGVSLFLGWIYRANTVFLGFLFLDREPLSSIGLHTERLKESLIFGIARGILLILCEIFLLIHYPMRWMVMRAFSLRVLFGIYAILLLLLHFFCNAVYKKPTVYGVQSCCIYCIMQLVQWLCSDKREEI